MQLCLDYSRFTIRLTIDSAARPGRRVCTKNLAGAEGFEPSALGFGDRCSDQTELRPYGPSESLPVAGASKAPTAAWQWELVATSSRRARVRSAAWRAAAGMVATPAA